MNVKIYREPCWLLEAAELVYSFVNEIPAEKMTSSGKYCIPVLELSNIRQEACASISRSDPQTVFYFKGVQLEGIPERLSCLGNCILHQFLELNCSEPEDMVQKISEDWKENAKKPFYITGVGPFTVGIRSDPERKFWSLAESIEKLPVPQSYQMRLMEVYSSFETHLQQVYQMLLPVTQALKELLAPWVQNAQPLLDQWETFFENNSPYEFFQRRARTVIDQFDTLEMTICFFYPNLCPAVTLREARTVRCMMGVSRIPSMDLNTAKFPEEWELAALRLVMNPARLSMLQAMRDTPMAVQELSNQLRLNVGAVSRDINNMRNARLLLVDDSKTRSYYRTNLEEIEKMVTHVLDYLKNS